MLSLGDRTSKLNGCGKMGVVVHVRAHALGFWHEHFRTDAWHVSQSPGLGLQWRSSDREEVKEDVMYIALYAKFTQHECLRKLLLGMGDCKLVEHTGQDTYWGDGGDASGQNKLGKLLMKLREELRKEIEETLVFQGGRKHSIEGGVELQSRTKSSCSGVSDNGSSID